MSEHVPSIGIDFGTTNSSMAWYDPSSGRAEVILNAEGESKTPSLVYFGDSERLIGRPVEPMIIDPCARSDSLIEAPIYGRPQDPPY